MLVLVFTEVSKNTSDSKARGFHRVLEQRVANGRKHAIAILSVQCAGSVCKELGLSSIRLLIFLQNESTEQSSRDKGQGETPEGEQLEVRTWFEDTQHQLSH